MWLIVYGRGFSCVNGFALTITNHSFIENSTYGLSLWKSIWKHNHLVLHCSTWKIGNGSKIRFWKDLWCGTTVLQNSFPLIFAISKDKYITVRQASEDGRTWNIEVTRYLQDWEVEEYEKLLQTIASHLPNNGEDKLSWNHTKNDIFSVRSLYDFFCNSSAPKNCQIPHKAHLENPAPSQRNPAAFFAWNATKERILTLDNLMKRGFQLASRCFLCKNCQETSTIVCAGAHLLLIFGPWFLGYLVSLGSWLVLCPMKSLPGNICQQEKTAWFSSVDHFLDHMEGKEQKSFWKKRVWFCIYQRINGPMFSVQLFWGTPLIALKILATL